MRAPRTQPAHCVNQALPSLAVRVEGPCRRGRVSPEPLCVEPPLQLVVQAERCDGTSPLPLWKSIHLPARTTPRQRLRPLSHEPRGCRAVTTRGKVFQDRSALNKKGYGAQSEEDKRKLYLPSIN